MGNRIRFSNFKINAKEKLSRETMGNSLLYAAIAFSLLIRLAHIDVTHCSLYYWDHRRGHDRCSCCRTA